MAKKIIIGVAGEMASGKGTVAQYLVKKHGGEAIASSVVFRRVLQMLHITETRETVSEMSRVLRMGFGEDIALTTILKDIEKSDKELFVIDGLRRVEEIDVLKASMYDMHLVYLSVDVRERYNRMIERNRDGGDAQKTFGEFEKNHTLNAESTVSELEKIADYKIVNEGPVEDLYKKVEEIYTDMKSE